jgi:hypothetical protein
MATAMFLPESVFENCLQVLVYQRLSGTIVDSVAILEGKSEQYQYRYNKLRPFGMIDCGYDPQFEEETFNRAKCIAYVYDSFYSQDQDGKDIKDWDVKLEKYDDAFYSWGSYSNYEDYWSKQKKVWEIISCQQNALSLRTKLRSIGINISQEGTFSLDKIRSSINEEIDNLKIVEHNRWNMEKLLTGFRTLSTEETQELNSLWNAWHVPQILNTEKERVKVLWLNKRKQLKEWPNRAHLDLCSFETLKSREEETILQHDVKLNTAIPYILLRERVRSNENIQENDDKQLYPPTDRHL